MGNTLDSCCDAKGHIDSSNLSGIRIGEGTNPEKIKNFSLPILKPEVKELIKKAERSSYFHKPTKKTGETQTVVYGNDVNRALYEGETVDGEASGFGKVSFQNGSIFEGSFSKGEPTNGIFVFNQSCYFVGNIQSYQASGKGVYENIENGYYYEGEWKKNLQYGQGIEKYSNKDQYEGGFMFGSKFGQGKYIFADGRVYEGTFYNGHSDGHGKMTLPNGDIYDGEWKLGQMHGKGTYKWKKGEKYVGEYENGVRHGQGIYYFSGGARYEGKWVDGLQEGEGTIFEGYDQVKGHWEGGICVTND